jgi:hypothetical protein
MDYRVVRSKRLTLKGAKPVRLPQGLGYTGRRLPFKMGIRAFVCEGYPFSLELPVNFFSEFSRAFKCDNPSFSKDQVFTRCWIAASALVFILDTKFTKPGDQYIFIFFQ